MGGEQGRLAGVVREGVRVVGGGEGVREGGEQGSLSRMMLLCLLGIPVGQGGGHGDGLTADLKQAKS